MKHFIFIILLTVLVSLAGCDKKPPTFADRVLAEGESKIGLADQWEQGKKDSIAGEKKVKDGRISVETGRANLLEGAQLIASGNVEVKNTRQAYLAMSQSTQGIDSGEAALNRVVKLKKIAKAWQNGEEKISQGNKLIKIGKKNINEGESKIRKGQKLLEAGREKMQNAESIYQQKNS